MHQYNTIKCNGQVFSFDIVDEEGCEVRITCFDEIAELHYHRVEKGAWYVVFKDSVKDASTVYNKLNNHLEIILTETSVLKRCASDVAETEKKLQFNPINKVLTTSNNTLVDVIGVVVNFEEILVIRRKDGSTVKKRIVKINDMSTFTIDVNLWRPPSEQLGNDLKNMHASGTFVILAIQNERVGYFNGKFINISASMTFEINPFILEANPLRLRGPILPCIDPHSSGVHHSDSEYQRMTIASILQRLSVMPETLETTIKVVLGFIKEDQFYYTTCPLQFNGKECKKKCSKLGDNLWLCPRCQTQIPECNYKYLLQMKLQDQTSSLWANAFDEVGTQLLALSAKELYMLQYDLTIEKTPRSILNKVMFTHYNFTVLVSTYTYNSERRLKVTINKVQRLDFEVECNYLLAEISRMGATT
ncbi:replication protein A 70 kDa DNA-binding subunit A-like [Cryptomeria japonica]|uniref:replication protein A 70 kDa DNA-binding subunit A-like n=1 Tax=Cryptomeria japonica TaxID=3369 RepID=UPI0027D9E5C6|nr:replication protein A 70 kDa DNA-binding subunit A-like [Cryptomeria japonica]